MTLGQRFARVLASPLEWTNGSSVLPGTRTQGMQTMVPVSMNVFWQLATLLFILATSVTLRADETRRWPNDRGVIIRADLVLVRSNDVVLRPRPFQGTLVVVAFDKLRPVDQRYLDLENRHAHDCGELLAKLLQPLRDVAAIHDAATLVRAAAHFRAKSKAEVLEVFEQCVDKEWSEQLWLLAPVIFEPCSAYPDFWREDLTVLSAPTWPGVWPWETSIQRGQPMLLDISHGDIHSGPVAPNVQVLIDWAKQHASMRSTWSTPELIPTELVNQTEELKDERHQARQQAWRLVRHLFSLEWKVVFDSSRDDERWNKLHELCTAMQLTWDDKLQAFRPTSDVTVPPPPEDWVPTKLIPTPALRPLLVRSYFDD